MYVDNYYKRFCVTNVNHHFIMITSGHVNKITIFNYELRQFVLIIWTSASWHGVVYDGCLKFVCGCLVEVISQCSP